MRADVLTVEKGLAPSRERARALIMAGKIYSGAGVVVNKPGLMLDPSSGIHLKEPDHPYVGRGGLKLEKALDGFGVEVGGKAVLDIGASTGGFTHCVLLKGAKKVFALDVGHGQLAWELRNDPRVEVLEKVNIRNFDISSLGEPFNLALIDISFISIVRALERLSAHPGQFDILGLVKPNFELQPKEVGKGGIVKDKSLREKAVRSVIEAAGRLGLKEKGVMESPVHGTKGNVEYFVLFEKRNT